MENKTTKIFFMILFGLVLLGGIFSLSVKADPNPGGCNCPLTIWSKCPNGYEKATEKCGIIFKRNWCCPAVPKCTDTDNGKDYLTKGTCTITSGTMTINSQTDECVDSTTLKEWTCFNDLTINYEPKSISGYICEDGALVEESTVPPEPETEEEVEEEEVVEDETEEETTPPTVEYSKCSGDCYCDTLLGCNRGYKRTSTKCKKNFLWIFPVAGTCCCPEESPEEEPETEEEPEETPPSNEEEGEDQLPVTELTTICTDSDGGKNYYVKGTVEGKSDEYYAAKYGVETREFVDVCSDAADIPEFYGLLIEGYCDKNGFVQEEEYYCPNGCKDGACLKEPMKHIEIKGNCRFLSEKFPDEVYLSYDDCYTGVLLNGNKTWTLINFDLRDIKNKKIKDAELVINKVDLLVLEGDKYGKQAVAVHKVTEKWNLNTASWSNKPGFDLTPVSSQSILENGKYTFDITSIINYLISDNKGVLLKAQYENEPNLKRFDEAYLDIGYIE